MKNQEMKVKVFEQGGKPGKRLAYSISSLIQNYLNSPEFNNGEFEAYMAEKTKQKCNTTV